MSMHRDTDRTLAAWLDLMPIEAPERVVLAVNEAVATSPQLSPRTSRLSGRPFSVNRTYAVGAAAIAVAAVVVVSGVGGRIFGTGAIASPTLRPTPVVTIAPLPLLPVPPALHGSWVGADNGVVDEHPDLALVVDEASVKLVGFRRQFAAASAAFLGADRITIAALSALPAGLCTSGLLGEYSVGLSPEGKILELGALRDDCPESSTTLAGTWWRSDCRQAAALCLGLLEAATYASLYLRPVLASEGGWWTDPKAGELSYTVPSGWATYGEDNWTLGLALAEDYASAPVVDNLPARPVARLVTYAQVEAVLDGCVPMAAPASADAAGFVSWLRDVPNLVPTDPEPISVDGFAGLAIDVTVRAGVVPACHDEAQVEILMAGDNLISIAPGERRRLIVLSLDDRNLAVISIEVDEASRFESFVAEAMPIIESMNFR